MANPVPCQRCLDVPDAGYYLTNRLDDPWLFDQTTVALCFSCMVQSVMEMADAYAQALAQVEAMAGPGLIEQAVADADADAPEEAPKGSKSRSKKEPEPVLIVPKIPAETEAPDVDG